MDMILGKNHINEIITTIDLGTLKFNSFSSHTFCEIQYNGDYPLNQCQIRASMNSWGVSEFEGVRLTPKGPMLQ